MARPIVSTNPGSDTGQPQALLPSLLDRLIDPDSLGSSSLRGYSPRQIMEAVRRDLEELFNTHQSDTDIPEEYEEVRNSIVAFGLPDLPSLTLRTGGRTDEVRRIVQDVIVRFEPRLRDVRVLLVGSEENQQRKLRFRVEAQLNLDPSPEVAFETVVELTTGQTSIRQEGV